MKHYDHFGEKNTHTHRQCYKIHMSLETEWAWERDRAKVSER